LEKVPAIQGQFLDGVALDRARHGMALLVDLRRRRLDVDYFLRRA
jgi:hypothetical protein